MNMRRGGSKPCLAAGAVSSGGWPVLRQRPPYQVTKTGAYGETDTSDSQGRARAMRGRGLWDAGTAARERTKPKAKGSQQDPSGNNSFEAVVTRPNEGRCGPGLVSECGAEPSHGLERGEPPAYGGRQCGGGDKSDSEDGNAGAHGT